MWTDEMRAKAAATRLATKKRKEAARLEREGKQHEKEELDQFNGQDNSDSTRVDVAPDIICSKPNIQQANEAFDWENCPLVEAINKQADMKREYDRISQIVLKRQNPYGKRWTCWTEEQRLEKSQVPIPKSVIALCARTGDDGRWKFRDDGRFVMVNGVRTMKPAFCCNSSCYQIYVQYGRQRA